MAASQSPPRSARTDAAHPLINRNFALLWSGAVISDAGNLLFATTLILWVASVLAHGQSWAPLAVSGIVVATTLPLFIVRPFAGVFVDRWDTRRTMLWMDGLRALLLLALVLEAAGARRWAMPLAWQLATVYVLVLLITSGAQFFNPAQFALIGDIVAAPDLPRASGLGEATWNIAAVGGAPLASLIVFTAGVPWALAADALSFVLSFACISRIQMPFAPPLEAVIHEERGARGGFWSELRAGIALVARTPVLRTIALAIGLAMLGLGALNTLEIFFVTQNLHAAPGLYGVVSGAFGAGSVAGAVLAGRLARSIGIMRLFWLALVGVGIIMLVIARLTNILPALVLFALLGIPNSACNVAMGPLQLMATPRAFVGRASSIIVVLYSFTALLSSLLAGYLVSVPLRNLHLPVLGFILGPNDAVLTVAGLLALVAALYAAGALRGVSSGAAPASPPYAGDTLR